MVAQQCADGLDNDIDGKVDAADPGCVAVTDNDETDPQVVIVPSSTEAAPTPAMLTPFPIVRLRGRIADGGVRVNLLSVTAPKGARVTVLCRGPDFSCPAGRTARTSTGRSVRFRSYERRMRNGTIVRIFVTKAGMIGKYTRFTIRRGKAPARVDACARPDRTAFTCPS